MARDNLLVFGSPLIGQAEIDEVVASLRSGWLSTGPKVRKFEQMFREYKGCASAIALNSCTAGLHLSLRAIGIRPGDEVIVPAMTFAATANAVIHAGGVPVLVDCERESMNMDPVDVERRITAKTRAMIPVHFAGRPCDMCALMEIAKRHGLKVVEDCAHATEAEHNQRTVGTIGDLGCFSFYVTKNVVTGEGGMVITDNETYADEVRIWASHGMNEGAWERFGNEGHAHYEIVRPGFKCRMMDLQAAIGVHQLPRVEKYWKRRREIWERYNLAFGDLPVFTPSAPAPGTQHSYHLYALLIDIDNLALARDEFLNLMTGRNIGVGVHNIALHLHPYYRRTLGHERGDFPNAEWISDRTVSLPLSAALTDNDVEDVIAAVRDIVKSRRKGSGKPTSPRSCMTLQ